MKKHVGIAAVFVQVCALVGCSASEDIASDSISSSSTATASRAGDFGLDLRLPFTAGEERVLTRAYNTATHVNHGGGWFYDDRYAIDLTAGGCDSWNRPVLAAAPGVVEFHGDHGYGNNVVLNHGNGCYSQYAHLNSISVSEGLHMVRGQEVGREGNTGHVTGSSCPAHPGSHVHFKVVCNGVAVLPEPISGYNNLESLLYDNLRSDNALVLRHLPGMLVQRMGHPEIYWIDPEGRLRWLKTEDDLRSRRLYRDHGDPFGLALPISEEQFSCYPMGETLDWPITMRVTRCADDRLYLTIDDRGVRARWWIPGTSGSDMQSVLVRSWGFRMSEVVDRHASCSYQEQTSSLYVRGGTILRDTGNGTYWYVDLASHAHSISQTLLNDLGYDAADIVDIPTGSMDVLTLGLDTRSPGIPYLELAGCGMPSFSGGAPTSPAPSVNGAGGGTPEPPPTPPPPPEPEPAPPDASPPPEDPPDAGEDAGRDPVPEASTDAGPPACIPTAELCNGVDEDCDGVPDNGFTFQDDMQNCGSCGNRCNPANDECHNGACRPRPQNEAATGCNNRDDDYDGVVDGYVLPCSGACGEGRQTCLTGELTACMPTAPPPEVCNTYDDDCDGSVDEGGVCPVIECDADHDGEPNATCGGRDCDDHNASVSPRATERCNGQDDTCNGGVDEGFDFLNDPTHCGSCANTCAAGWVCLDGRCTEACAPTGPETCNGVDDDCDGLVDEATVCSPPPSACTHRVAMVWTYDAARWSFGTDISGGGERFPDLYWWPAQTGLNDMLHTNVCPGWVRANIHFPDSTPSWLVYRRPDGTVVAGPSLPRVTVDGVEVPLFPVADPAITGPEAVFRFCLGGDCP